MNNYPRILFLNINFRYDSSDGITISKLVDHFPRETLFLVSDNSDASNIDIFASKFQLSENEYKNPIGKKVKEYAEHQNKSSNKVGIKAKYLALLSSLFRAIIGGKIIDRGYKLSEDIIDFIKHTKPDYIYLIPSSLENIDFALNLAKRFESKIIVHVLDDKVNGRFPGITGYFYKRKFQTRLKQLIKNAAIHLAISDLMADKYKSIYNQKFYVFHNTINVEKWLPYQKKNWSIGNKIKVVYTGMVEATASPILFFCNTLKAMNEKGYNVEFVLYSRFASSTVKQSLKKHSYVRINDYVSQEELPEILSKADILLLPLPFEIKYQHLLVSMPTKTTEYMISGVPILVFAPEQSAVSFYAKKNNWGCLVEKQEKSLLVDILNELINNENKRRYYGNNSISLAIKRHNQKNNKEYIDKILEVNTNLNNS